MTNANLHRLTKLIWKNTWGFLIEETQSSEDFKVWPMQLFINFPDQSKNTHQETQSRENFQMWPMLMFVVCTKDSYLVVISVIIKPNQIRNLGITNKSHMISWYMIATNVNIRRIRNKTLTNIKNRGITITYWCQIWMWKMWL